MNYLLVVQVFVRTPGGSVLNDRQHDDGFSRKALEVELTYKKPTELDRKFETLRTMLAEDSALRVRWLFSLAYQWLNITSSSGDPVPSRVMAEALCPVPLNRASQGPYSRCCAPSPCHPTSQSSRALRGLDGALRIENITPRSPQSLASIYTSFQTALLHQEEWFLTGDRLLTLEATDSPASEIP